MATSQVGNEQNICQLHIYSTKINDAAKGALVIVKHGYKMTKRGFIRTLLLVFPTKVHLLFKHTSYVTSFYREPALTGAT